MTNQQGAPEALTDPSPDQLRAIARTARNSSGSASDDCGPLAYVLHGWRAAVIAFRAQQAALVEAQQPAPSAAAFDAHGFHDWVLRNMPDDTIIGSSAWWADHLTAWAKRFVNAAPQPSPTPQADSAPAEPLHITHGPLMRHAAALLRSRKPVLPDHESVAAELEMAADGHPTPAGDPSPEWLEVARIAMEQAPQADNQPAPVADWLPFSKRTQIADRHGVKVTAEFNALVRDVIQTYLETHADRAARAPADSQPAPAGFVPVAAFDRLHAHAESLAERLLASEQAAPTPPAQAADSVLDDAARLDFLQLNGSTLEVLPAAEFGAAWCFRVGGLHKAVSSDLRAAIDAARKQGGA